MELLPGRQRKTSNATGPGILLFIGYREEKDVLSAHHGRSELARIVVTTPRIVTDWFARRKTPISNKAQLFWNS
jgi:hypothetical protein